MFPIELNTALRAEISAPPLGQGTPFIFHMPDTLTAVHISPESPSSFNEAPTHSLNTAPTVPASDSTYHQEIDTHLSVHRDLGTGQGMRCLQYAQPFKYSQKVSKPNNVWYGLGV